MAKPSKRYARLREQVDGNRKYSTAEAFDMLVNLGANDGAILGAVDGVAGRERAGFDGGTALRRLPDESLMTLSLTAAGRPHRSLRAFRRHPAIAGCSATPMGVACASAKSSA